MTSKRRRIDRGAPGDMQPGIALVRGGSFTEPRPRDDVDLSSLPETWRALPVAQAELLVGAAREAGGEVTYTHDTEAAIDAAKDGTSALLIRGRRGDAAARGRRVGAATPEDDVLPSERAGGIGDAAARAVCGARPARWLVRKVVC